MKKAVILLLAAALFPAAAHAGNAGVSGVSYADWRAYHAPLGFDFPGQFRALSGDARAFSDGAAQYRSPRQQPQDGGWNLWWLVGIAAGVYYLVKDEEESAAAACTGYVYTALADASETEITVFDWLKSDDGVPSASYVVLNPSRTPKGQNLMAATARDDSRVNVINSTLTLALEAGDVISISIDIPEADTATGHGFNGVGVIEAGTVYTIARSGGANQANKFYFAEPVLLRNGDRTPCTSTLRANANEFFSDASFILPDPPVFSLRDSWGGMISESRAVRAGNFLFSGGGLQNFHAESRWTPWRRGAFSSLAAVGYKQNNGAKTAAAYGKISAEYAAAPQLNLYAQTAAGGIDSAAYQNGAWRGFAFGAFYDWRHNGALHAKIESPASSGAQKWRIAADMRIGAPQDFARMGFFRALDGKNFGMQINYQKEF